MGVLEFYYSQAINGIANGCIYGMLALAMVFIYRAGRVGNFAQAEQSTLSAYLHLTLIAVFPYTIALLGSLALSFLIGAAIHIFIIRKVRNSSRLDMEFIEIIITIGLISVLNGLTRWYWGSKYRVFPSAFSDGTIELGATIISINSLGIIIVTALLAVLLKIFFQYSNLGIACEAVSENRLAAASRGIRVNHILAFSWGVSAVIGGLAGSLGAPILNLHPDSMWSVFIYGFIAAVLGGLKSPFGSLASGVLIGLTENLAGTISFIGSELKTAVVFLMLVVVLYFKPKGLFGGNEVRKV